MEQLAKVHVVSGLFASGAARSFMNAQEYAAHARISPRSLSYAKQKMTEGIHYSRTGKRIRYHVAEADEFLSQAPPARVSAEADLKELARNEAKRRVAKATSGGREP